MRCCSSSCPLCRGQLWLTPGLCALQLTEPNHWKEIQIPHSRYLDLRRATTIHERAVSLVSPHELLLASGRRLSFDVLVLATGSSYAQPIKELASRPVFYASRGATLAAAY